MRTSEQFQKTKNNKNLTAVLVIQRHGEQFIRLCFEERSKITKKSEIVFVECPTEIEIESFQHERAKLITEVCFHESFYHSSKTNQVKTILKAIRKDSDVKFRVRAFNMNDYMKNHNLVCHELLADIDGKVHFMSYYVGEDNSASPVK